MHRLYLLLVCGLIVRLLPAQEAADAPRTQWSFGYGIWFPLAVDEADVLREVTTGYAIGHSIDVEARRSRWFSYLITLGVDRREGVTSWGTVPINTSLNTSNPNYLSERNIDHVDQQFRRLYVGVGGQVNLRVGQGDLNLGALATVGQNKTWQTVAYGYLGIATVINDQGPNTLGPSGALDKFAHIHYQPILQTGARLQLQYTYWFSRQVAFAAGGYYAGSKGRLRGDYIRASRIAYQIQRIDYQFEYYTGIDGYGIPAESYFVTPSPTALQTQWGAHLMIIYKPGK